MIYLYYGKIGDGKTYHVMYNELLPAVRDGRKIYTNIDDLDQRHIRMLTGVDPQIVNVATHDEFKSLMECDPNDKKGENLKIDHGSLVIIDEAQLIWDARDFRATSKKFLTLLEYHRHFGLDLVFITQNPKRLEASVTRLANNSYQVKNLGFIAKGLKNRYVLHIRQTPFDRDIVATMRGKFHKPVFACYRSAVAGRNTKVSSRRKSALQGGLFYFIGGIAIFLILMIVSRGGFHLLTPMKVSVKSEVKKDVSLVSVESVSVLPVVQSDKVVRVVHPKKIQSNLKGFVSSSDFKSVVRELPDVPNLPVKEKCVDVGYTVADGKRVDYKKCGDDYIVSETNGY